MVALGRWSLLLLLLLAVVVLTSTDAKPRQDSGKQETKRASKFQKLREQFEIFKRELEDLLVESSIPEQVASVPQVDEPVANLEKKCQECDDSSFEKRCPSGCKKPQQPQQLQQLQQPQRTNEGQSVVAPESEMMKRFLKALPEEDKRLVEGSKSKRQFIERLIRRTNHGPNANDIAADRQRAEERVNAIADIGVRSMPAEDSGVMLTFKRSLSPDDQRLLQKYKSKTRFIEGVLEKQTVHDDRDVDVAKTASEAKRGLDDPVVAKYLQNLDESQRTLIEKHPSIVGRLKEAILKGRREGQEKKRELNPDEIQSVLKQLASKEDQDVVKQHLSIIEKVAEAEKKPVGNADEEEVKQVVSRLASDIKIARKRGYDLEKLLVALKKRAEESKWLSEHK